MKLAGIVVNGNDRMKLSFFENELDNILRSSQHSPVKNQNEFKDDIVYPILRKLQAANVFEDISINVEENNESVTKPSARAYKPVYEMDSHSISSSNSSNNDSRSKSFNVIITVKETKVPYLRAGSFVEHGKASNNVGFELKGALRSPFGYGEQMSITSNVKNTGNMFEISGTTPLFSILDKKHRAFLSLKSHNDDASYYLSFKPHYKTVTCDIEGDDNKRHKFSVEASLRDEVPLQHSNTSAYPYAIEASRPILSNVTFSTKLSAKYQYTIDHRDSASNPSGGQYLQSSLELALPPGDAQYLRHDLAVQTHAMLGPKLGSNNGLTLSLCAALGFMLPINAIISRRNKADETTYGNGSINDTKGTYLCDRYHLGGPLSMRGFQQYGLGLRADPTTGGASTGDALGGMSKFNLLALVSCPLPISSLADFGGRSFLFLNAGNVGLHNNIYNLFNKTARLSAGAGLSFTFSNILRFEITYTIPILKSRYDVIKPFQLGIGLSIG